MVKIIEHIQSSIRKIINTIGDFSRKIKKIISKEKILSKSMTKAQLRKYILSQRNQKKKKIINSIKRQQLMNNILEENSVQRNEKWEIERTQLLHELNKEISQSINAKDLSCPLCLQLIIFAVVTECGHCLCLTCLDECLLTNTNCPICRACLKTYEYTFSRQIDTLIRIYVETRPQKQSYICRLEQEKAWRKKRQIKIITHQTKLDVKDTQGVWCSVTILSKISESENKENSQIYSKNIFPAQIVDSSQEQILQNQATFTKQKKSIIIHFDKWNCIYNQIIHLPSWRLAPWGFYTSKKNIRQYDLGNEIYYVGERDMDVIRANLQIININRSPTDIILNGQLTNAAILNRQQFFNNSNQQDIDRINILRSAQASMNRVDYNNLHQERYGQIISMNQAHSNSNERRAFESELFQQQEQEQSQSLQNSFQNSSLMGIRYSAHRELLAQIRALNRIMGERDLSEDDINLIRRQPNYTSQTNQVLFRRNIAVNRICNLLWVRSLDQMEI